MADFEVHVIESEYGKSELLVEIPESRVPTVITDDGAEELDYGNADWPSDGEIAREASRILARPVTVKWFDRGDSLTEGLYDVIEEAR